MRRQYHNKPPTGDLPPLDIRDAGNGKAWLRVNMAVDWPVALDVMKLLKDINL